jgi:hypothetical protein
MPYPETSNTKQGQSACDPPNRCPETINDGNRPDGKHRDSRDKNENAKKDHYSPNEDSIKIFGISRETPKFWA